MPIDRRRCEKCGAETVETVAGSGSFKPETVEWFVLDARAPLLAKDGLVVTDRCIVLEACGQKRPTDRYLRSMWGEQGAWLAKSDGDGFRLVKEIR